MSGVALDANGNVYLDGFAGYAFPGIPPGDPNDGDSYLVKYAPHGDRLWVRQAQTSYTDSAAAIAIDAHGNPYVVDERFTQNNDTYTVVKKFNPNGALLWRREFRGWFTLPTSAAVDPRGGILACGWATNRSQNTDAYLVHYSATGAYLGAARLRTAARDNCGAVGSDRRGRVVIAGGTFTRFPGAPEPYAGGESDAFVAVVDSHMHPVAVHELGSPGFEQAYGLATDAAGRVAVMGFSDGILPGAPSTTPTGDFGYFLTVYPAL
ncbi:MAG TPA: hypothetical protein VGO03_20760 [Acidimicrobiia bacterium]|jgi:hypothetical protein